MNSLRVWTVAATLMLGGVVHAETEDANLSAGTVAMPVADASQPAPPQLSENPKMKAEGKRLAALMEKLQKESNPEERRKIMSEAMCPQ